MPPPPPNDLPRRASILFFSLLALLSIAHVIERTLILSIPEIDEGWQLVLSQHWSLGYYGHPPLYTWLQIIFFKVFGESIFSLALLKNALLFAMFAFTYGSAKLLTGNRSHAIWTTLCLLLVPQISWECYRDLTHSVLLGTTTASTLFLFLWVAERPGTARYAALGVSAGAMLLAKYNAAMFLIGGAITALFIPRYRALLLDRRLFVTLLSCLVVAGPHFAWASQHANDAFAVTSKLGRQLTFSAAAGRLPMRLVNACLPNLIPAFVVYLLARRGRLLGFKCDAARLILWTCAVTIAFVVIGMLVAHSSTLRGRWFLPVFVLSPLFVVAQIEQLPRWLYRLVAWTASASAIAVLALLPVNAARAGTRGEGLTPAAIANVKTAASDALKPADVILADDFWLGGAIRLAFQKPVIIPKAPGPANWAGKRIIVAYGCKLSTEPPQNVRDFLTRVLGRKPILKIIHLTPDNDPSITGMRLGIATVE